MTTEVQVFDAASSSWVDLDYTDFSITNKLSTVGLAPSATATVGARGTPDLNAGQDFRIRIDGTTRFKGALQSPGDIRGQGQRRLQADHRAVALFEEAVTFSETGPPTDEAVLQGALDASGRGANFTLSFDGTPTTLGNDYAAEGRAVKTVFRDIADRTGWVWWVDPAGTTIDFEPLDSRGLWASLDPAGESISVDSYSPGSVGTVRNDIEVVGTGDVAVTGTATDSSSITDWGRQTGDSPYKFAYITSQSEADTVAQSLLVPDPLPQAVVRVPAIIGGANPVESSLVNFTVDLTDDSKGISETGLTVVKQEITQGQARLTVGRGSGQAISNRNRREKSEGDVTEPGSTYDSDRIADGAVGGTEISDGSVTTPKLDDLAVTTTKIDDVAVSEPKISDSAVASAKLDTSAVTSGKIATSAVLESKIDASAVSRAKIADAAVNGTKVEAATIGTTKLVVEDWIPVGLTLTSNAPGAGEISWSSHSLVYEGTEYDISAGSTSDKYVYWNFGDGSYSTATASTKPSLGANDALVAINDNGTANKILQATLIDGGSIITGTITAVEIEAATITANEIDGDTITANEIASGTITANEINANTITAAEIAAGSITAAELQIADWLPVGLTLSDNTPTSGEISWNSHELVYDGTSHSILGGSTSDKYVYWQVGNSGYSTSNTKPTLGADDALVAINDNGTARKILQATVISGGAITTGSVTANEISAGTITATEISSGTITATQIDALDLDAGELSVTDSGGNGVEFVVGTFDGDTHLSIVPTADGIGNLGNDSKSWDNLVVNNASVGTLSSNSVQPKASGTSVVGTSANLYDNVFTSDVTAEGSVGIGSGADRSNVGAGELEIVPDGVSSGGARITTADGSVSASDVAFIPETDDDGLLGAGDGSTATAAWQEIHAYNRFSYTPAPLSNPHTDGTLRRAATTTTAHELDLAELLASDWADPPAYVSQAHEGGNEWTALENGAVEHGHLLNYLLETCKAQQAQLDDLRERVAALESRDNA